MNHHVARIIKKTLFFACALALSPAFAKSFKSKFVSLELPPNWDCQQEELDWVCQPENPNIRNEAIVVIVTKAVHPTDDNLIKYEEYLKSPKQMRDLVGNSYVSQIRYTRQKKIRELMWVDSLQVGSEVPGFVSRYVAGIKEQVAALISYHVAESMFSKWSAPLDAMIESAELRFDPKAFDEIMKNRNMSLFGKSGAALGRGAPKNEANAAGATKKKEEEGFGMLEIIIAAAMLLGIGGYVIHKRRQSGG